MVRSVEHYHELVDRAVLQHPNNPELVSWVVSTPLDTILINIAGQMVEEATGVLTSAATDELQELWIEELHTQLFWLASRPNQVQLHCFFTEAGQLAPFISEASVNRWLIRWHAFYKAVTLLAEAVGQLTLSHPPRQFGHD